MAPHGDKKGKGKEKADTSSRYPTAWSAWTLDEAENRWYQVREIAKGKYEYAFEKTRTESSAAEASSSSYVPRKVEFGNVDSTQPTTSGSYPEQVNYSTTPSTAVDPVSDITGALAGTSLQDPPSTEIVVPSDAPHVATRHPSLKEEKFDKNYKQHSKRDFRFGKVFKMLWSEPKGSGGGTEYTYRPGPYGEEFCAKVRRFVIVNIMSGHCICIPIMSYGNRGTKKPGVHADEHAIIYTSQKPALLEGEKRLAKAPIKVKPYSPQHKLEPASRLNYAKVYTIEYNVKVWFIGEVEADCEWKLIAAYNEVHPPLQGRSMPSNYNSASTMGSTSYQQPSYTQFSAGTFPTATTGFYPAASGSSGYPTSVPASQTTQAGTYPTVATSPYGPITTSQYPGTNVYPQQGQPSGSYQGPYSESSQYQSGPRHQHGDSSWDHRG